jgi:hypothetical protein
MHITSMVPRDHMTEEEAVRASELVVRLRALRKEPAGTPSMISVTVSGSSTATFLPAADADAVRALLIERYTAALALLGVIPQEPSK